MPGSYSSQLLGTLKSTFRFGPKTAPHTLATAATAARTATFPDKSGTVAFTSDLAYYKPLTDSDELAPDFVWDDDYDVVMTEFYPS